MRPQSADPVTAQLHSELLQARDTLISSLLPRPLGEFNRSDHGVSADKLQVAENNRGEHVEEDSSLMSSSEPQAKDDTGGWVDDTFDGTIPLQEYDKTTLKGYLEGKRERLERNKTSVYSQDSGSFHNGA